MLKKYFHCTVSIFLLFFFTISCSKNTPAAPTPQPEQIQASATSSSQIPILKGVSVNPYIRIAIQHLTGKTEKQFRKIKCSINPSGLTDVKKVEVYLAGESFVGGTLIGSSTPTSATFEIPVTLNIQPGLRYVWLTVELKEEAVLAQKIEIKPTKLIDAEGKEMDIDLGTSVLSKLTGTAIRRGGDDNVNTYRIPGIVQTDKGTLLSVYDIRYKNSGDLPGNIDVGLSRSTDNGKTWAPMKVIMDMGAPHDNNGVGDPSILFDPITKKIWVSALWSKGNRSIAGSLPGLSPDETGQFVVVSSDDDGVTWTAPYTITPQIKNPAWHIFFNGPGSGIAMQDGKLVFAAQYWNESKIPYSTIIYSDDHGSSWKGKILGPKSNTTESQVVETTPGTLMLNMRDNRGSFRSVYTTTDIGANWLQHPTSYSALPDPVCMGSLIKAKVNVKGSLKDVLFFSNPNTSSGRYNITIKASLDYGTTWLPVNQLLIDERVCYGYSSLTKIDDNTIGILYEGTKDLYFVKVAVSDIIK